MPKSIEKYERRAAQSQFCVGLDPVLERIPAQFQQADSPIFAFNRWIIEQTHEYVCAYKPNIAFYEAEGENGMRALRQTIQYLQATHPEILIIVDAKRGDMNSTSAAYAHALFDDLGADAVTLHPYLGGQSLLPFLERTDKACIIVCRTSNPGAGDFQDLDVAGRPLWQHIAQKVYDDWNGNGNCMLVMGATYPVDLAAVREIVGDMPLLVPGIGAQGGDLAQALQNGLTQAGSGLIISASRSVIYADNPGAVARDLNDQINRYRAAATAG
jgi:orotidine-5'-phosphate decarboxylase